MKFYKVFWAIIAVFMVIISAAVAMIAVSFTHKEIKNA